MISLLILILLIILIFGSLPRWGYSSGWGYYPSGTLTLILIIVLLLYFTGHL